MKVCVLAPDVPYPANRGGRVDVMRRLLAMKSFGHDVLLLTPQADRAHESEADATRYLASVGIDWRQIPRRRGAALLGSMVMNAGRLPFFVARRHPAGQDMVELTTAVEAFGPDLLWLDGPWLWPLARQIRRRRPCALAYRSHNVEHRYMQGQAALTRGALAKLKMRLSFAGLEALERAAIADADAFFDISLDDLQWWRVQSGRWLPPLPVSGNAGAAAVERNDVVFVGNLTTPNNVAGVRWLVDEVMPLVRQRRPEIRLHVVGSNPASELVAQVERGGGVVDKNVDDPFAFMLSAGVLVNPVMAGSGVQLKMLDMLMTDRPIVSGTQGMRGLPESFLSQVRLAKTPQEFAEQIIASVDDEAVDVPGRQALRRMFDARAVDDALNQCVALAQGRGA
ncbi:glycosyltransferase [Roseateles cavernae]|uniref:glycosyltransferase n=1 Tax=Roseateles cavernae TaxID=3153578 RepID=UPI0032E4B4CD